MKVSVDKSKCIGCGMCASICPKGFKMENGKSEVIDSNADCVKDAANACPVHAIKIEEEPAQG